jgi:ssDNA-binding Zn-finger/Zn-ribbon topoisomerase 1
VTQALKNSYWLRDQTERLLKVKPWITQVLVFTNAFVKFGSPVKGVRVVNKKYLLQTLFNGQGDASNAATIWANRERLANHLTGQEPASVQPIERPAMFCPKCGKKMVEKIAKGGKLVAGKPFWVCPDYPQCKTAIPAE